MSDITYIKVASRWLYLCVIIDLFARKVIAYHTSNKINADLVIDTFNIAYLSRKRPANVLFHSDRGCQYTSAEFRKLLDSVIFIQSFSAKGHPYDNAVAESFFKFLKLEETNRRSYHNKSELDLSLFEYFDGFYNSQRPHSANHNLTPIEKENLFHSP